MKFFTEELWSKMNSDLAEERLEADNQWFQNANAYWNQFKCLNNRISQKLFSTLLKHSFHDYRIEKIEMFHDKYWTKNPIKLSIIVSNQKERWVLTYKSIKKVSINYEESKENSYFAERIGFDTWGYDEILAVDEELLSHEIIFASGASIIIHFKNKNMFINKLLLINNKGL